MVRKRSISRSFRLVISPGIFLPRKVRWRNVGFVPLTLTGKIGKMSRGRRKTRGLGLRGEDINAFMNRIFKATRSCGFRFLKFSRLMRFAEESR
ncbi:hypothetical protein Bca52824_035633 [Brassica carinata]|uniref:Uncharacterized protein n=1 Tax=Brassica carinata TaxID=52824 RepID=A0A8X7V2X9_BRACI|nr:hypothetical protein Bca52824_035633 [Brassica carinata]